MFSQKTVTKRSYNNSVLIIIRLRACSQSRALSFGECSQSRAPSCVASCRAARDAAAAAAAAAEEEFGSQPHTYVIVHSRCSAIEPMNLSLLQRVDLECGAAAVSTGLPCAAAAVSTGVLCAAFAISTGLPCAAAAAASAAKFVSGTSTPSTAADTSSAGL